MTFDEKECLFHLKEAFNIFVDLPNKSPVDDMMFCYKINELQNMLAMRVCR